MSAEKQEQGQCGESTAKGESSRCYDLTVLGPKGHEEDEAIPPSEEEDGREIACVLGLKETL